MINVRQFLPSQLLFAHLLLHVGNDLKPWLSYMSSLSEIVLFQIHYVARWKGITFMTSRQGMGVTGGSVRDAFLSSNIALHLDLVKPIILAHFLLCQWLCFSYPTRYNVFVFLKLMEWECSHMGLTLELQSLELFWKAWITVWKEWELVVRYHYGHFLALIYMRIWLDSAE